MRSRKPSSKRRVLLVDDEEGFRESVADLLSVEGYAVSMAKDAVEAMQILPTFQPEVILLDLRMPLLDGELFLKSLRGLPFADRVRVVLVSGQEQLATIAHRCGAAGFLAKPFEAPELLTCLERVLR